VNAKIQEETDRKAEIARIQAESQTQIDRQTRLEKGEIRAAKNALHPTGKKSSHKSKARKFIADADSEEHNVVVELEVPQQDEEVVVEESEERENIPDQPEPLTEEEEASANAQRDEIDEILAHAEDANVFEEEQKDPRRRNLLPPLLRRKAKRLTSRRRRRNWPRRQRLKSTREPCSDSSKKKRKLSKPLKLKRSKKLGKGELPEQRRRLTPFDSRAKFRRRLS